MRMSLRAFAATAVLAIVVSGRSLRSSNVLKQPEEILQRPDSPLDDLFHDVTATAARARASAADARTVAAETGARSSADQTAISQYTAEDLSIRTQNDEPVIQATIREAAKQKGIAAQAAVAAENAYNTAGLRMKEEIANAAKFAGTSVDDQLANTYKQLQDWKMEVLHDPLSEARIHAQQAAAPYQKALNVLHGRVREYQQRAEALNNQAMALQKEAKGLAGVATGTMAAGLAKAADAQMKQAHHFALQSTVFLRQAQKLELDAQVLSLNFSVYQSAAQAKAAEAAHRYAPDMFAPPPVPGNGLPGDIPPTPVKL